MKADRYAYTNSVQHLRLHLGTEFQLVLIPTSTSSTYLPDDQHDRYISKNVT